MFVQVNRCQHWKSEHDETTCEDAGQIDSLRGLFALSDGAGTTLYSNIWAQVLVDHFVTLPLLSDDPFEVEWWVRLAQERYRASISAPGSLPWNVLQKVQNEGSFATLATLRITEVNNTSAHAEILLMGDTCIFVENGRTGHILSFPLTKEDEFDHSPICIPSKSNLFNRYFQRSQHLSLVLESTDTIVMVTDAVARWIISAGKGRYKTMNQAFHTLIMQTPLTWESFILDCRSRKEMVDDDSTALTLSLQSNPGQQQGNYLWLGSTNEHDQTVRKQRKEAFERATQAQNKELMAIYYGDGKDLSHEGVVLATNQVQQIRAVADALREMLSALRDAVNSPDVVARIGPVWRKYAPLLATEPCAEPLRQTLSSLGIPLSPKSEEPPIIRSEPDYGEAHLMLPPHMEGNVNQAQENVQSSASSELGAVGPLELLRERERLALEKQFLHALRSEDDEMLLNAHQAIIQSVYADEIIFSLQDKERIERAQQNVNVQQYNANAQPYTLNVVAPEPVQSMPQDAMVQASIQDMALAYKAAQYSPAPDSEDEQKRLALAYAMDEAFKSGSDDQIVKAYENILHSSYHSFFIFSPQEEEIVIQAERRKLQHAMSISSSIGEANAPTISDAWFRTACQLKKLYLLYQQHNSYPDEQIEQWVLADLANDRYIQEAIEFLKKNNSRKIANPESLLKDEFSLFRSSPLVNYDAIRGTYQFSDDDAKAILLMFIKHAVFEQYLMQNNINLQKWLDERKRDGNTNYQYLIGAPEAKRSRLFWWRR